MAINRITPWRFNNNDTGYYEVTLDFSERDISADPVIITIADSMMCSNMLDEGFRHFICELTIHDSTLTDPYNSVQIIGSVRRADNDELLSDERILSTFVPPAPTNYDMEVSGPMTRWYPFGFNVKLIISALTWMDYKPVRISRLRIRTAL